MSVSVFSIVSQELLLSYFKIREGTKCRISSLKHSSSYLNFTVFHETDFTSFGDILISRDLVTPLYRHLCAWLLIHRFVLHRLIEAARAYKKETDHSSCWISLYASWIKWQQIPLGEGSATCVSGCLDRPQFLLINLTKIYKKNN